MKEIKTVDAVGHVLCHDLTQIIAGESKEARFRKGHVVTEGDIPVLLDMGKEHLFVWETKEGQVHEDEGAALLASLCQGEHMVEGAPKEGKIDLFAQIDGLLKVDVERLRALNSLGELIVATRYNNDPIKKGEKLAGTRVIPLVIAQSKLEAAQAVVGTEPLLTLVPFLKMKAGIITTGSEVATGRIKDSFTPVVRAKLEQYGVEILGEQVVSDEKEGIVRAIHQMKEQGAQLILCTGGMSVDPDDRTPGAIKASGATIVSYGAPVLPGAMFLLGYFADDTPIIGLPGCVMYSKTTIFDLILPRILVGEKLTHQEIAALGHGGLCLNCEVCHWPICGFGKGM